MPRLTANLTMLWPELPDPYARIAAAAGAGFTSVERLFPQTLDRHRLAATLREQGVEMVLFVPLLHELDRLGYTGSVALEYRPIGATEDGLAWAQPFLARQGLNRPGEGA